MGASSLLLPRVHGRFAAECGRDPDHGQSQPLPLFTRAHCFTAGVKLCSQTLEDPVSTEPTQWKRFFATCRRCLNPMVGSQPRLQLSSWWRLLASHGRETAVLASPCSFLTPSRSSTTRTSTLRIRENFCLVARKNRSQYVWLNHLMHTSQVLSEKRILGFYLGSQKVFFVTGPQNVATLFRNTPSISADKFHVLIMETLANARKEDTAKYAQDRSGRLVSPAPGWEKTPESQRYWAGRQYILHEYLWKTQWTNGLAEIYYKYFSKHLERFPLGEWSEMQVFPLLQRGMAESAITSMLGSRILEETPNLTDLLWDFDSIQIIIAFGPPKWLFRGAWKKRDRFFAAVSKYLYKAWAEFDWDGDQADADWEPVLGSRYIRELAKWSKRSGFSDQYRAGVTTSTGIVGHENPLLP